MLNVATHSGTFHADDVFAYTILKAATNGQLQLLRSRDAGLLAAADVLFDVGGIFDRATKRYDHHMRDQPLRDNGEPYSSAGLVWRDFGAAAVQNLVSGIAPDAIARVVQMVDQGLVRDVDLMDNGAMVPLPGHFSTVVEAFNITFAEGGDENVSFHQAADLARAVLSRVCARAHAAVLAETTVAHAAKTSDDPRIIVLDTRVPWEDAVFDLDLKAALFVIRPAGDAWTCSAIPPDRGSFAQRLSLPDSWGGLRDESFAAETGIADATFCHPALFVCGARSRAGTVALAQLAVARRVSGA